MKFKVKEILPVHAALTYAANVTNLSKDLNYCIAKNLIRLKKSYNEFNEENTLRIETYAEKDPRTNEPIVLNGKFNFGENTRKATEEYKTLIERECEFEPYTIKRSEETDVLPAVVLQDLLDIIIID